MDRLLGTIIDDYTLYKIIQAIIVILSLFTVYLGIQIALDMEIPEKGSREFRRNNFTKRKFHSK